MQQVVRIFTSMILRPKLNDLSGKGCRRHHWDIPLALSGTTSQERRPAKTKKNAKCILLLNRESERSIAAAEKGIKESTNTSLYRFTII